MRKELEDILYEASPAFYRERTLSPEETLMCFGFECGDGWFEPLLEFSKETRGINELASKHHICFVASQVKQGEVWENQGLLAYEAITRFQRGQSR